VKVVRSRRVCKENEQESDPKHAQISKRRQQGEMEEVDTLEL